MAPAHPLFISIALPPKDSMAIIRGPLPSPPPDNDEPHDITLPISPPRVISTQPLPPLDGDVLPAETAAVLFDSCFDGGMALEQNQQLQRIKPMTPRMQLLPSPPYDDDTPLPTSLPVLPPRSTSPPHTSPHLARNKLSPLPPVALPTPSTTTSTPKPSDTSSLPYVLPEHFFQEKAALTQLLLTVQEQDREGKARDVEFSARLKWIAECMKATHAAERERLTDEAKTPSFSVSCPTRSNSASPSMLFGCGTPLDPAAIHAQEIASLKREETQVRVAKSEERKKRRAAQERVREVQGFLAARAEDEALLAEALQAAGELDVDEEDAVPASLGGLGIFTDSGSATSGRKKNAPVPIQFLVPLMIMRRKKEAGSRPLGTRCRDATTLARIQRSSSQLGRPLPGIALASLAKSHTGVEEADQLLDGSADGEELGEDELLDGEDEEVEAMDKLLGYGLALSRTVSATTPTSKASSGDARTLPVIRIPTLLEDPGATCFSLPLSPLSPPSPSTDLTPTLITSSRLRASSSAPSAGSSTPSTPSLRSSFGDLSDSDQDSSDEHDVEDMGFELAFDEPDTQEEGERDGWVDIDAPVETTSPPASPLSIALLLPAILPLPSTSPTLSPPPSPKHRFPLLQLAVMSSKRKLVAVPTPVSSPTPAGDRNRGRSLYKTPSTTIGEIDRRGGGAFIGNVAGAGATKGAYGQGRYSWFDPAVFRAARSGDSRLRTALGGAGSVYGGGCGGASDVLMVGVLGVGADECGGGSM